MRSPPTLLQQQASADWLIGGDSNRFHDLTQERIAILTTHIQHHGRPRIFLLERNPERFLAGFMAACATGCPVFLCKPDWGQQEWQQVLSLAQPDLIWGNSDPLPPCTCPGSAQAHEAHWIMIPTGGSTGSVRFAIHTWQTLMASVQGTQQYFYGTDQSTPIHSYCVLPLHHVSGLMQFLRTFCTDGQLVIWPFKALEQGNCPAIDPQRFFISLVPTQLQRLLQHEGQIHWLAQFQTVLLGGAPAWPQLLQQAREHNIRLALTYGMTETASQVATLQPEEFLQGNNSSGQVLPHARILIQNAQNQPLAPNQIGQVAIQSQSLCLGYYPLPFSSIAQDWERGAGGVRASSISIGKDREAFVTDDRGFIDDNGDLHILGRTSRTIITGGEKVLPEEVETIIRATGLVADIYVIGVPDPEWGEVVTAIYVPAAKGAPLQRLQTALVGKLSRFKHPKQWRAVPTLPRNGQGKIHLTQLQTLLASRSTPTASP